MAHMIWFIYWESVACVSESAHAFYIKLTFGYFKYTYVTWIMREIYKSDILRFKLEIYIETLLNAVDSAFLLVKIQW